MKPSYSTRVGLPQVGERVWLVTTPVDGFTIWPLDNTRFYRRLATDLESLGG